jgi:hypothetical protein
VIPNQPSPAPASRHVIYSAFLVRPYSVESKASPQQAWRGRNDKLWNVRGKLTNTKAVGSVNEKLVPGSRISADSNFFFTGNLWVFLSFYEAFYWLLWRAEPLTRGISEILHTVSSILLFHYLGQFAWVGGCRERPRKDQVVAHLQSTGGMRRL